MNRRFPQNLSAQQAAASIPDGATLLVAGFGAAGVATAVHEAIAERFRCEQKPRGITYIHGPGQVPGAGLDLLMEPGLVHRVIGSHWGVMRSVADAIPNSPTQFHNWPQGVILLAIRHLAGGERKGFISPVGLGTFIDPDLEGGCINTAARAAGTLIQHETTPDGLKLRFPLPEPGFALIRGWSVDTHGNLSCGKEALLGSIRNFALAARACGGKVFCQYRERENRVFRPEEIDLPAFLIDALIEAEVPDRQHRQIASMDFDPALLGHCQSTSRQLPPVPGGWRGLIGRRAAREIQEGDVINLGIGIPGDTVGPVLQERGDLGFVTPTIESGLMGGIPLGGADFGAALMPEYRLEPDVMFDLYHGGHLDIAIMGAAEVDGCGNVNVSSFANRTVGCGGFIDITQSAKHVVFCSPLTTGGLRVCHEQGSLRILEEGKITKWVPTLRQITFSGAQSQARRQKVLLVTERCVFRLQPDGWEIMEVAAGIDPVRQVQEVAGFPIRIASDLKVMPIEIPSGPDGD